VQFHAVDARLDEPNKGDPIIRWQGPPNKVQSGECVINLSQEAKGEVLAPDIQVQVTRTMR